jgi:alpha-1,6-mannosyltransferase
VTRPIDAAASRAGIPLFGAGAVIAGAFWTLAWLAPRPGEPLFIGGIATAAGGYLAAVALLSRRPAVSPLVLAGCLGLALAWRAPLLILPEVPAHDAVRYLWDARTVEAGLNPYVARPDDPALASLHTDVTRGVDAAWLPTIYPPVAQLYFRLVGAIDHSVAVFRVAALASDIGITVVVAAILRATGQPLVWVLLYAWHPLPPVEGVGGAHVDLFGVLLLTLSWLALLRLRTGLAALAFAAAVMVKPLPVVLAPLYWRRIRRRDAALAVASAGLVTLWIAKGGVPWGSTGAFLQDFKFNGPLFATIHGVLPAPAVAAAAVAAGLAMAVWMRRTRDISAPEAWAWPMAVALMLSPVIYPWYLVWLIPFAPSRAAAPVWLWTLSILVVYPTWHLRRLGAEFVVPAWLMLIELGIPAIAAIVLLRRRQAPGSVRLAHG